jgi:RNA polymerase sigma factor (sigma-70 family)
MATVERVPGVPADAALPDAGLDWCGLTPGAVEAAYVGKRLELIRVLMSAGSSLAEAEDIVQDVFLRALRHFQEKPAPDNLFAWLVACAKHAIVDGYRSRHREVMPSPGEWESLEREISDRRTSGIRTLIDQQRLSTILQAIDSLDDVERRCLFLWSEGAKFREMAEQLGIPLRTAAYHTNAAIEKLQRRVRV